jgi:hypothetical protein
LKDWARATSPASAINKIDPKIAIAIPIPLSRNVSQQELVASMNSCLRKTVNGPLRQEIYLQPSNRPIDSVVEHDRLYLRFSIDPSSDPVTLQSANFPIVTYSPGPPSYDRLGRRVDTLHDLSFEISPESSQRIRLTNSTTQHSTEISVDTQQYLDCLKSEFK